MKDKIIIDGITYVRADKQEGVVPLSVIEKIEDICIQYNGMMYEDDVMVLDASRIESNDMISSITYTDKTNKPWKEDYIDNENWLMNILDNQAESIKVLKQTFKTEYQQEVFKAFLLKLRAMGWL